MEKSTVPTPSLGDYSNSVVTSKWVKDVSTAAVYVSPDGDDSNSGMTVAESVKTIVHALELCSQMGQPRSEIYLAAGSYDGDIDITEQEYILYISGTVNINGHITARSSSIDIRSDSNANNPSLFVNDYIRLENRTAMFINDQIPITVTNISSYAPLAIVYGSSFITSGGVTLNAFDTYYALSVVYNSVFTQEYNGVSLIINGSNISSYAIAAYYGSSVYVLGSTTIQKKSESNTGFTGGVVSSSGSSVIFAGTFNTQPGSISGYCIVATKCSLLSMTSTATIYGAGARLLDTETCSNLKFEGDTTLNLETANTSPCYSVTNAVLSLFGNTTINAPSDGGATIFSALGGYIEIANRTIKINGSWVNSVICNANGYFYLNPSGSIALQSGASVTKKGTIAFGGILCVSGTNPENRIPGTNSFTISTGGLIG